MGTGYLIVQVKTGDSALPVGDARVRVLDLQGNTIYDVKTDQNGNTEKLSLDAPDAAASLNPNNTEPTYSLWNVIVRADGYRGENIRNVQILDTETAILPVNMEPLEESEPPDSTVNIVVPPHGMFVDGEWLQAEIPPENESPTRSFTAGGFFPYTSPGELFSADLFPSDGLPFTRSLGDEFSDQPEAFAAAVPQARQEVLIPSYITVHLGTPTNTAARNVRVRFTDYLKNVASSEIYATWPPSSLIANINAIVTFAINRVYTEWYRSRGYNFDVTNSTQYDQYYREGAQIYENLSRIVDEVFNVYARRIGFRNPFFTSFCNGTTATCAGLSQWGTVTLAKIGIIKNIRENNLLLPLLYNMSEKKTRQKFLFIFRSCLIFRTAKLRYKKPYICLISQQNHERKKSRASGRIRKFVCEFMKNIFRRKNFSPLTFF
ncbi:MAG: hypothetical protein FWF05_06865, partial [Oscillospiraceae bacterium]|nr:hypothetical protein [Oscillospiraceae bacterium]